MGGSCLAGSGAGEARGSSPTANYNDYQVLVPFEALVRGKLFRLGFCACTFVCRWFAASVFSVSSMEVSVFARVHRCFPYRLIQTSLLKKKNFRPIWDLLYSSMAPRHTRRLMHRSPGKAACPHVTRGSSASHQRLRSGRPGTHPALG